MAPKGIGIAVRVPQLEAEENRAGRCYATGTRDVWGLGALVDVECIDFVGYVSDLVDPRGFALGDYLLVMRECERCEQWTVVADGTLREMQQELGIVTLENVGWLSGVVTDDGRGVRFVDLRGDVVEEWRIVETDEACRARCRMLTRQELRVV